MIIIQNQWCLKIILFTSVGLDFYNFHRGFSSKATLYEARWMYMTFTAESQLFLTRLLDKFYIIIYIFLYIKISKYE